MREMEIIRYRRVIVRAGVGVSGNDTFVEQRYRKIDMVVVN